MELKRTVIKIRDIVAGYNNDILTHEVTAMNGKLNIRPKYQREFVYSDRKQKAVIDSIIHGYPLNILYWVDLGDEHYEVMDGQQRLMSICNFVNNEFTYDFDGLGTMAFSNLDTYKDLQDKILDYELDVYICTGTDSEKMAWFSRINTQGEKLTDQELRNAVYSGDWVTELKKLFSYEKGRGVRLADFDDKEKAPLLNGKPIRQEYLERALEFIALKNGQTVDEYMAEHKGDADCADVYRYFSEIITWVRTTFVDYNAGLKGIDYGKIYKDTKEGKYDHAEAHNGPKAVKARFSELTEDDEVTAKLQGIDLFLMTGEEKNLNLRSFDKKTIKKVYEKQNHMCPMCVKEGNNREYSLSEMEADHAIPWSKGGKTTESNCVLLCLHHNRTKSSS